ncbi:MAG: hypothetical protein V2A54_01995 [Bacteroidota bacterium]
MKISIVRRIAIISFFVLFVSLMFCCKKSNNTRRIAQKWQVHKYIMNLGDSTHLFDSLFMNYQLDFNKNGSYTEIYYTPANQKMQISGTWLFEDKYETLQLKDTVIRKFRISQLTKDRLDLLDSMNYELEMIPF